MKSVLTSVLASIAITVTSYSAALASPDAPVIALANAYYGNTWRHQMVDSFEAAAKEAKDAGQISDYIIMNGDGSVAQQNSQIAELILKKVDVIAVNAASETAVNGIIEKACSAGIIVVSFDSIASAPCNYQLNFDFTGYKAEQAEAVIKMLGGKGNIIQVRGVKGSAPDNAMYNAQQSVLAKYPDIKVVATVHGQATASVAQAAINNVLPSLPHVDAVLAQGGSDDVGIAQAFVQYGGEYEGNMPIIEGGGGTDFVKWWAQENEKNGYQTVSMNTTPGIGGAVFWLGLSLLNGAEAPKLMIMPVATVDADNLQQYADLPAGQIISPSYSLDWVKENLLTK
ncbi:MAG: ABC transporter substrate-binding protein [Candidatus Competibacteraceae bacterium]|nr:ABC transporter substrate-binding protein [Candidatus Competibacteraceae bacterium]MCB1806060.1 ABC transporter substrate-binding protein [Candidatus Competibacteraceae bacterium]MCB1815435.1 ABC transporter substrate-binding protein [Candidatus Competibacteraceae bacterium]